MAAIIANYYGMPHPTKPLSPVFKIVLQEDPVQGENIMGKKGIYTLRVP
jgi:hypothetical protein